MATVNGVLNGASKAGRFLKAAGPWGVSVLALVLVGVLAVFPGARADPYTGAQAGAALAEQRRVDEAQTLRLRVLERDMAAILAHVEWIRAALERRGD